MSYNKETGMYEGFIYLITNNVNGKRYVGQTRNDIATRWRGHKSNAKNPNGQKFAIHLAIDKYGIENFSIRQIEKLKYSTLSELIEKLYDDKTLYKQLSENSYRRYCEEFTADKMTRKTEELYMRLYHDAVDNHQT